MGSNGNGTGDAAAREAPDRESEDARSGGWEAGWEAGLARGFTAGYQAGFDGGWECGADWKGRCIGAAAVR